MRDRPMGFETEYEFAMLGHDGRQLDVDSASCNFMSLATRMLPSLQSAHVTGVFLQNGGLLLKDSGSKIEFSTPETLSPFELATFVLAGHQIVAGVGSRLVEATAEAREVMLSRCNVDYSGCLSTWAAHESYLTEIELSARETSSSRT